MTLRLRFCHESSPPPRLAVSLNRKLISVKFLFLLALVLLSLQADQKRVCRSLYLAVVAFVTRDTATRVCVCLVCRPDDGRARDFHYLH